MVVETLEGRKDQMISALWSNSNYDDDKGTRQKAIEEIESNFQGAVNQIFSGKVAQEEEIDESNPFFVAAKKSQKKLFEQVGITNEENPTVKEIIDYHK